MRAAFTLVELMTVLIIVSILSSLSLAGLGLSRQRAKAIRTETTIRKIHEVVMPHYERYLGRNNLPQDRNPNFFGPEAVGFRDLPEVVQARYTRLIKARRVQAIELPDDWRDLAATLRDPTWAPGNSPLDQNLACETAISRRLRGTFATANVDPSNADAECLWAIVMRGGFGDPGIIGHFREDEFGDTNGNGFPEFIDGWGRPIRFLRWAPGFVSRYQPQPRTSTSADTRSHDVFDTAGVDPLALNTLYPLIFSGGPNGQPDIQHRLSPLATGIRYPAVAFDPYFATRGGGAHLVVTAREVAAQGYGSRSIPVAPYAASVPSGLLSFGVLVTPAGAPADPARFKSDDIHNHALSR